MLNNLLKISIILVIFIYLIIPGCAAFIYGFSVDHDEIEKDQHRIIERARDLEKKFYDGG